MARIPTLPLSALLFYLLLISLWRLHLIPSPTELLRMLELFYQHYGLFGLVLATFLEGIAYICLYVPGAFIIALTVFFSDNSLISLVKISLIVSGILTLTSLINYYAGRFFFLRKFKVKKDRVLTSNKPPSKLIISMLHPNLLAFYFFNSGFKNSGLRQIIYVPLFMFPYGLLVAFILSIFSSTIRYGLESPTLMLSIIIIWFTVAYFLENKKYMFRK